jgi:hypothetical protein
VPVDDPRDYPWPRPSGSYRLDVGTGRHRALLAEEIPSLVEDRSPLLAVGSNAAPARLAVKLRQAPSRDPVAVVAVDLIDHDAVFAARQATYGAVPATFRPSPGTRLRTHTAFVDVEQRAAVDRSEGVASGIYEVVDIDPTLVTPVDLDLAFVRSIPAYRTTVGELRVEGEPRALAALEATRRQWPPWTELEVLHWIAAQLDRSVEDVLAGSSRGDVAALLAAHRGPPG